MIYNIGRRNALTPACKLQFLLFSLIAFGFYDPAIAQSFIKHQVDSTFAGAHAVQAFDLDGDGDMDFAGASMTAGRISWWENGGDSHSWTERIVDETFTGARYIDAIDLDADGDLDLFGAAASLDAITWWENSAGDASTWIAHAVDDTFDFAMHVHATDLDADGDIDLLGAALKDDAITWWENMGDALTWERHTITDTFDGARHVCAVDIDGDGDTDLLGSADIADTVKWWSNTAGDATEWEGFVVDSTFEGVNGVIPVDIDDDGDADLLGAADEADDIVWWEQVIEDDSLVWNKSVIKAKFDGAFSVVSADMDNDDDMDILGVAAEADQVVWWENLTGIGDEWMEHIIQEAFEFPMHVNAADIDGDGDVDVMAGNFGGEVAWWENPLIEASLPVELSRFDAVLDGRDVRLAWETASELNNAGFEIQHAASVRPIHESASEGASSSASSGPPFEAVSFIQGAGTTTESQTYSYSLDDMLPGRHRFRLKQIDFDGAFEYSHVVEVRINSNGPLDMSEVYPNPFNPQARFYLSISSPQKVQIDVYNALGQRVVRLHEGILGANESYEFDFHADDLPGGLYVIHAAGETFSSTRKAVLVK